MILGFINPSDKLKKSHIMSIEKKKDFSTNNNEILVKKVPDVQPRSVIRNSITIQSEEMQKKKGY